jgi:hypothetical protein
MTGDYPKAEIEQAVTEAMRGYLASRRERVRPFTERHFSVPGALRLNARAVGLDVLRTPFNVLWAGPYLLSRVAVSIWRLTGTAPPRWLERVPAGFKTDVERQVEWLIYSEWLELPFEQGNRRSTHDALFAEILAHPAITALLLPELIRLDDLGQRQSFRERLQQFLGAYTASRTVAADLTGSLLNLAAGAAAFQKLTPGTLSMGQAAAAALAQHLAVSNFALGPTLGSLYYAVFPAAVPAGLLAGTIGGLLLALGVLTAFAGLITDPVQQALGLHERKLQRLLDALEQALLGREQGYAIHDAYVARVFDLWDLLQTAVRQLA